MQCHVCNEVALAAYLVKLRYNIDAVTRRHDDFRGPYDDFIDETPYVSQ